MKKRLSFIFLVLLLTIAVPSQAKAVSEASGEEISRQQMEAQISFFSDALNEFGASSPEEAVTLWAKGDKTRNGVYKYAVSCPKLKKKLISKWGGPEKSFWIIGGSSPWLTGYEITAKTVLSPSEMKYSVKYEWATSAGPEKPSCEELLLKNLDGNWCVIRVIQSDGYHSGVDLT